MRLKKLYLLVFCILLTSIDAFAALVFEGLASRAVEVIPMTSTGLDAVYVIENADGVSISYDGVTQVKWSKFSSSGAAYAIEIGVAPSIDIDTDDCGYVAEVDGRSYYYWIVNYQHHQLMLESVSVAADGTDCGNALLDLKGQGNRIVYYTINGRPVELSRELKVIYNTLTYDADEHSYMQTEITNDLAYIHSPIVIPAPLCDTKFIITGDRFLVFWGKDRQVESSQYETRTVSAETMAEQIRREVDNEQSSDMTELGGSAPCEIDFSAVVSDATTFYEWQLSKNPEFDPIDDRYTQTDLNYTFRDQGTTYVRFFAADASGSCEYIGPTYNVNIGVSNLLCPNAFTPNSSPGVNDEWKVSYKSIVEFECHIFNRWGTELFYFSDPSMGWDGKYKGKFVSAGTYYYVIKAQGADGREYKLSGDINIIKSKDTYNSSEDIEE